MTPQRRRTACMPCPVHLFHFAEPVTSRFVDGGTTYLYSSRRLGDRIREFVKPGLPPERLQLLLGLLPALAGAVPLRRLRSEFCRVRNESLLGAHGESPPSGPHENVLPIHLPFPPRRVGSSKRARGAFAVESRAHAWLGWILAVLDYF